MKWCFTTLVLLLSLQLSAQIVNIEDKRKEIADTIAWYGFLNFGVNLVENGNSVISINGDIRLEHSRYKHHWMSLSNYNLTKVGDKDFINNGFQHLRYNYKINPLFTYEAFTQIQFNEAIRLKLRSLLGTGLRMTLMQKENHRAFLGLSYMFEYNEEQINGTENIFFHRDHRLSSYFSFITKPAGNFRLSGTTYFQPLLNDFSDLRLSSQTALLFDITKRLHFSAAFNIVYDSRVREGVANTIYSFKNGLRWEF